MIMDALLVTITQEEPAEGGSVLLTANATQILQGVTYISGVTTPTALSQV